MQVVGAIASKRFGGKPVIAVGLLLSCACSAAIPAAASLYPLLLFVRVLMGLGQGVMYPAMCEILSKWVISSEKSFWISFSYSGGQAGTIVGLGIYPILCDLFGWKFPFIAFGAPGVVWAFLWVLLVHESPEAHPSLSSAEKAILEKFPPRPPPQQPGAREIPWGRLFRSWRIYPVMLIYFGYNWPFYLMVNSLPTYLETVFGFKSSEQGFFSMLPYIFLWLSLNGSGLLSDYMIRRCGVPLPVQRKLMVAIGLLPSAGAMLLLPFLSSFSVWVSIGAIIFAIAMPGFAMSGFSPAPFDLSSEYAGGITSMCTAIGGMAGIICPIVSGKIIDAGGCSKEVFPVSASCQAAWWDTFFIGGSIYIISALVWIYFSSFTPLDLTDRQQGEDQAPG